SGRLGRRVRYRMERGGQGRRRGGDDLGRSRGRASPLGPGAPGRARRALSLARDQTDRNKRKAVSSAACEARASLAALLSAGYVGAGRRVVDDEALTADDRGASTVLGDEDS